MTNSKFLIFLLVFYVFFSCKKEQSVEENYYVNQYVKKSEAIAISNLFTTSTNKISKEIDKVETFYDKNNIPVLHIINYKNKGFLLVSGDKHFEPILGYSDENSFAFENIPVNLKFVLDIFKNKVADVRRKGIPIDSLIYLKWQYFRRPIGGDNVGGTPEEPTPIPDPTPSPNPPNPPILISTTHIGPLLQTSWGQGCGYNSMMPDLDCGPCHHAYTGCVTTAMAQIMKYYEYPQIYDWNAMPIFFGTTETAQLMHDIACAIPINDDYNCIEGTGAYLDNTESAFIYSFNYSSAIYTRYPNPSYNIILNNLSNSQPILFGGFGHAWVCDGLNVFEYNTYTDYFYHMNWGWDGYCDGYYRPNLYETNNGNYSLVEMVYNIHP